MTKEYLGDAVYVDFDGHMLTLTTENGISVTNTIHLEPEVYGALTQYVQRLCQPKSSKPGIGDVVGVMWNEELCIREIVDVGVHPPYVDCVMVKGLHEWFPIQGVVIPDINNHLLVPIEEDDECPNCRLGTVEKVGNDVYVCQGECGAFFRGPCQHPNRNMNGGCDDCGDPSL